MPFRVPGVRTSKLLVVLLSLGLGLRCIGKELTEYEQLGRDVFKELIETDTTHSTGDTTKAAELLAKRFRSAGFTDAEMQVLGPGETNKNLVLRFRGSGEKKPVVLMAHLDVVEAKREDWSLDPFKFTEKDGYFYGRGTSDDKDSATTLSIALIRLRKEGFKPNRDLVLMLTAGEEGGEGVYNGAEWLLQNHKDMIDGVMCFNADSGGVEKRKGHRRAYVVQAAEKVYQSYRLEAKGPGGHSSQPSPDNTIYHLANALVRLSHYQFTVKLSDITRRYFAKMSEIETGVDAEAMKGILKNPPDEKAIEQLSRSAFYNALIRTTAVATMLEAGHAENALPQSARAVVNCRLLPGESPEEVLATLKKVIADQQITITPMATAKPSPASPMTSEVVKAIESAITKQWPGLPMVPVMETGATDGLYFRQLGIPTYGVVGTAGDVDDQRAHGKDERMGVEDFYQGLEFHYQLIKAIASN
jgi:acetylornithine deacetylase/succinyl-diaminopimelate desuccinylase-like protein